MIDNTFFFQLEILFFLKKIFLIKNFKYLLVTPDEIKSFSDFSLIDFDFYFRK